MEKIKQTLADWRRLPAALVPIAQIECDPGLQPRSMDAVPVKHRHRLDELSTTHVERLRAKLLTTDMEAEAVLIADCQGRLLMVDGHHRLDAYRKAGRGEIPARVRNMDWAHAVMVSKLVNCDHTKLPLHSEQARDAAWQFLAVVTRRGTRGLPRGLSLRTIAAEFGASKSTVARMLERLSTVKPEEYGPEACDPGTEWPRWRYVRGNAWRDICDVESPEEQMRQRAEKLAAKLAKLKDESDPQVFRLAIGLLIADDKDESWDRLEALSDIEAYDREAGLPLDDY